MLRLVLSTAALLAITATTATAHMAGDATGFARGLAHPAGSLDHILAAAAVGVFAARFGRPALWLVPLTFLAMMVVGGTLAAAGGALPFVETGIALSVVILGLGLGFGLQPPTAAAMALAGVFAVFHGYAHGAEMPHPVSAIAYAAGLLSATALLHAAGIGVARAAGRAMGEVAGNRALRVAGAGLALAGVAILAG